MLFSLADQNEMHFWWRFVKEQENNQNFRVCLFWWLMKVTHPLWCGMTHLLYFAGLVFSKFGK